MNELISDNYSARPRLSTNSLVQAALTNEWLNQQGMPDLPALWVACHYPPPQAEPEAPATAAKG